MGEFCYFKEEYDLKCILLKKKLYKSIYSKLLKTVNCTLEILCELYVLSVVATNYNVYWVVIKRLELIIIHAH